MKMVQAYSSSEMVESHFAHNITWPAYLYENGTIYHASNNTEVLLSFSGSLT